MPSDHIILELRTGRSATHTPESAAQLFSTLPVLKNTLFEKLQGKSEHLSFEILVQNQTIYFLCYCPKRLTSYVSGALTASYPEVLITQLEHDPLWFFLPENQGMFTPKHGTLQVHSSTNNIKQSALKIGTLVLKNKDYFPLKTYEDFKDVDPLSTLLSTLSKSEISDLILIQFLLDVGSEKWKRSAWSALENSSLGRNTISINDQTVSGPHPQKALIEKKLKNQSLKTEIRIAVQSADNERSQLLLDSVATSLQSMSQSESNALELRNVFFLKRKFLNSMENRSYTKSLTNLLLRSRSVNLSTHELATLYHLPNEKLNTISNIAWGKNLLGEPPENLPYVSKHSPKEIKHEINVYAETLYKNTPVKYGIKRKDRRRHTYVIGKTGTGKSTLLANMAINDLKNNEGLCVIDPHGDLVETLLNYIPSHRINDVVYFDPSDNERTVQINLFEGENMAHRELIASGIISVFQKMYGYSWGPRLEYILRNSLLTLLKSENSRLSDILQLLTNEEFRSKMIEKLDDPILKSFWVDEFNKMQDRQRTEAIASVLNKVGQFVTSPLVRNVVNARKSSFDIKELMDNGKILLVNLSQGKLGEDNATLLGAMLITKIQLAAMARVHAPEEDRRDFYLYVDEFQNFATESFNKILSEARKYRLNLTLANQYIFQIPEAVQKAIFGNCGNIISFVMGADDAEVFSKEYGELYSTEDLVQLGRYQVINKISVDNILSRPFPSRTLQLASSSNKNREKVIRVSRERYAKKKT